MPVIVPHRFRRKLRSKLRSRQSPASSLASLQTSFSPADTLRSLRAHRWSYNDGQYLLLIIIGIFSLCVIETIGPMAKTLISTLLLTSLILPVTRQFFLPFLPIAGWLVLFYACRFVPGEYRPPIWVRVLPALENILYGANLSNIMSAHQSVVLDVLAWLPYGIMHYGAPFVVSIIIFVFAAPGTLPVFARSFGYMNLTGVAIQLLFPTSPPWYENLYGLAPANYSIHGSPAGLARIDKLFGIDLYTSGFTASPLVFGAFPSLHAGAATIQALFLSHIFPRLRPLFVFYTLWIWWATMYLSHHYAVDLVGGSLVASVAFYVAKANWLPRYQPDKLFRWDYDYTEVGDVPVGYAYGLADIEADFHPAGSDSDEWTIGSSTSISSGAASPVDEGQSLWEGDTLASHSDSEPGR
ncbi:aureobasidin resistance protein Aur1 [Xylona heveae TC161]|uniref:Aureobasidin resistance protein Aur1 n=1 Tax=Xylona heveae (strain CBS 132557 / TC161) TaxID=1328760 RepID=A0A165GA25_XYLHT|nr:aureobasidin resistance protein Aur1 [Xylona heveae TC161]KZF21932.1 aureobasidin resistance protein Aur1 [Xylona heveae TC161]